MEILRILEDNAGDNSNKNNENKRNDEQQEVRNI